MRMKNASRDAAFVNSMIVQLVRGESPQNAWDYACNHVDIPEPLHQVIRLAPHRKRDELRNTGWVRHTLESAVWGLLTTTSFEEALVRVINLGGDADTAGTVVGALAGAAYGLEAIPDSWAKTLRGEWPLKSHTMWDLAEFTALADRLADGIATEM